MVEPVIDVSVQEPEMRYNRIDKKWVDVKARDICSNIRFERGIQQERQEPFYRECSIVLDGHAQAHFVGT